MNVRALCSLVLACATVPAFAACAKTASAPNANAAPSSAAPPTAARAGSSSTLHLYIGQSPTSLNPLLATTALDQYLALLAYDTLVTVDAANHLQPRVAREVPTLANGGISPDGKTVTFALRHDVRWHDGQPLTSADVAFTLAKVIDPKVDVSQRTGYDRITHVATPDPYTVVITLREPFSPFVSNVGYQYPIVPKHLLDKSSDFNRDPIGSHPLGSGPYRFVRWDRGNDVEYTANESYFGGAPKIKNLVISEIPDQNTAAIELRTHRIDLGFVESSAYSQLRQVSDLRTATEPTNDIVAYALNTTRPVTRDIRVRRAISMAIDRESIVRKNTFGTGTVAYADLPAALWSPDEPSNPYAYSPQAANALLESAGWKRGPAGIRQKDGAPLRIESINFSGSKTGESIDVQVQQMLQAVGIAFTSKYFSPSLYFETKQNGGPIARGDFDMAVFTWQGGTDPENDVLYTCANREPDGPNAARYCSAAMDALQNDSLRALDPARRAADVVKIERLAVTDVPYVFLYHTPYRFVWNPKLSRTHSNLVYPWNGIERWTFSSL